MNVNKSTTSRGREQFGRFKKYILLLTKIYSLFPMKIRVSLFEQSRNIRGRIGLGIRYALLKSISFRCGDNVAIYPGVYIFHPQNLSVGNNVSIHPMCYVECGIVPEGVYIGDDVSIAHGTTIMASTHTYADVKTQIKNQEVVYKNVRICDDVWIGAKSTVLAGVTVASGCVIGANSVVTKDTEEKGVYVGAPSKKIKSR